MSANDGSLKMNRGAWFGSFLFVSPSCCLHYYNTSGWAVRRTHQRAMYWQVTTNA